MGATLVTQTHFDPGETIQLVDEYDATYLTGLGVMFERMLEHDVFDPSRVETVETGVVGFISKGIRRGVVRAHRIDVRLPGGPALRTLGGKQSDLRRRPRRSGGATQTRRRAADPPRDRVEDRRSRDARGTAGRRGGRTGDQGYLLADGYLGKPAATAAAFDEEGWFYTGDLAETDADGYVYYRSRLDDALRVRGFLVAPREIGAAVEDHPDVRSCEVVGAPHPRHGEVPVAFVVSVESDGDEPTSDGLEAFLESRVADYKVPEAFEFVDGFPTTEGPNGEKVRKTALRERVRDQFGDSERVRNSGNRGERRNAFCPTR